MIKKDSWVLIKKTVLEKKDRADNLPDDTKSKDLILWVKGYLLEDTNIDEDAKVRTITGRIEEGKLVEENPNYNINYGSFVPELLTIGEQVKDILFLGGDIE